MLKKGCLFASCFCLSCAFAANPPTTTELQAKLSQISQQTQKLEKQVVQLQQELAQRKSITKTKSQSQFQSKSKPKPKHHKHTHHSKHQSAHHVPKLESFGQRYTHGVTVTTSPLLGIRSDFNADDLVVNLPTMNEDLRLLQQRKAIVKKTDGVQPAAKRPLIELSGDIEAQAIAAEPFVGRGKSSINLSTVELDILANISSWATGLISLDYDDTPPSIAVSGSTVTNSRIFLERGFLTIGNLNKSPFYASFGQMYVPFGNYSTYILSTPLTQDLGRTLTRAAELGFFYKGFYDQVYAFNGDTLVGSSGINEWGANTGYQYQNLSTGFTADIGAGYISNVADSQGVQDTGGPASALFTGFGEPVLPTPPATGSGTVMEKLEHRVPAIDIHTELSYQRYSFLGEYITAVRSFARSNLSFNHHGATPSALNLEAGYKFHLFNKPFLFALGYEKSWQSLGLSLPQTSYLAILTASLWKNTIEGVEFRHDVNYSSSDTASGQLAAVPRLGATGNTVTFQVGVYF